MLADLLKRRWFPAFALIAGALVLAALSVVLVPPPPLHSTARSADEATKALPQRSDRVSNKPSARQLAPREQAVPPPSFQPPLSDAETETAQHDASPTVTHLASDADPADPFHDEEAPTDPLTDEDTQRVDPLRDEDIGAVDPLRDEEADGNDSRRQP